MFNIYHDLLVKGGYAENVDETGRGDGFWEYRDNVSIRRDRNTYWCQKYSWAVPDERAIEILAQYSPLVEIGAGTGYWARLVKDQGGQVFAFDSRFNYSPEDYRNIFGPDSPTRPYHPITPGGPEDAGKYPDCTLFLCWPPYAESMAADALKAHWRAGGKRIIYIGEGRGGCTGDDTFHRLLEKCYNEIDYYYIPQWWGMHDSLHVYERKMA